MSATAHGLICERGWGPSQSEQEEADRPRRGVSPRQGVPCSAAVTAVGEQRHRILSRDGEAARRVLVPQIDFTLLSPSGGGDTNLFHTTRTLTRLFIPTGENRGEVGLSQGRKICSDAGNPGRKAARSRSAFEFAKRARKTPFRDPWNSHFLG